MPKKSKRKTTPAAQRLQEFKKLMRDFDLVCKNKDWPKALEYESKILSFEDIPKLSPSALTGQLGMLHYGLGVAHRECGSSEKALTLFFKILKGIEDTEMRVSWEYKTNAMDAAAVCCLDVGKFELAKRLFIELIDLHEKQRNYIMTIVSRLKKSDQFNIAIQVMDKFDVLNRPLSEDPSTGLVRHDMAHGILANCLDEVNDFRRAIRILEQGLNIVTTQNDIECICLYQSSLARSYAYLRNDEKAHEYIDLTLECLEKNTEIGGSYRCHCDVGEAYLSMEEYTKAINFFENAASHKKIDYESLCNYPLVPLYRCMGKAHLQIQSWDNSISNYEKALKQTNAMSGGSNTRILEKKSGISLMELGRARLEHYLSEPPKSRDEEILQKALSESMDAKAILFDKHTLTDDRSLFLDLAQEYFLLHNIEEAHYMLAEYLDFLIVVAPTRCHRCHQVWHKDESNGRICGNCMVITFCGVEHHKLTWKKGRISHKSMCSLLNGWRRMKKDKVSKEECESLMDEFLSRILR